MSVLKSLSGYQMYRQHVRLRIRGPDVLSFLLQNRSFPRAVGTCLERFANALLTLPRHEIVLNEVEPCREHLSRADIPLLASEPERLHAFVDDIQLDFSELHDALAKTYFARVQDNVQTQAS